MATAKKTEPAPRFADLLTQLSDAARVGKLTRAVEILAFIADARGRADDATLLTSTAERLGQ